ncbi:LysR family transcriptional regulator [Phytohabitans sp. ZYX-F-186]|uniref:LysR family transcriptional regulator n=1 Tax=Phytohabitans maris TaxID=3071409 RepID=A0ABU0ZLW1_9ACTN|nr:LysR family transcriptional regulator [Phytohabitans sp. ZYX-F-186]MDQ7908036.1 LysR family transcriptional regulator [Phytohabitans sp. ZYX-F-186]
MSQLPDLESLRLLVRVAELGSVGQAARAVGMTQPSATKRLGALERRVGLPLLVRTPRGSSLTNDGRVMVDWSVRLLAAADEFQASLAALREARVAQLRIAASMTVAEALLPGWLHQLRLREPDVRVGLTVVNSTEVARLLLVDESVDIGFVEGPRVPPGLGHRTVGHDELIVVVAPRHPWARRRRPLLAGELAGTRLVVREVGSGTRDTLELALRGLDPVPAHLALGSNAAVKGAAMAGSAPAVLSRYAVEAELATGRLVAVPVAGLSLARTLRAVWPRGRRLTGAAAALLQAIDAEGRPRG